MSKRKRLSFILVFALVMELIPFPMMERVAPEVVTKAFAAEATATPGPLKGTCGDDISWSLTVDDSGEWDLEGETPYQLTLTGTGTMTDYSLYDNNMPWEYYRANITSVSIGKGITELGDYAFGWFSSLRSVTIPDTVIHIGEGSFYACPLLEEVNIGTGVKSIGEDAFISNTSLKTIIWNENLEEIGDGCFVNCTSLNEISLPDSLLSIGDDAFGNTGLTRFLIPENVKEIGSNPVYNCKMLTEIMVAAGNEYFKMHDDLLYEMKDGAAYRGIVFLSKSARESLKVLRGTQIIDQYTFFKAENLKEIVLPNTLQKIELHAISYTGIEALEIPDSVTDVEVYAISNCDSLNELYIGKNVQTLERSVIYCENLETLIADGENPYLCSIDNVVYNKDCTKLYLYAAGKPESVYHMPDTVEELTEKAIYDVNALKEIYVSKSLNKLGYNECISHNANMNSIYFTGDVTEAFYPSVLKSNASDLIVYREEGSTGWEINDWESYFTFGTWNPEDTGTIEGELDGLLWEYERSNGRISLTGSGEMPDFTEESPAPWEAYLSSIQTIEAEVVINFGDNAFSNAESLLRLKTGENLSEIGDNSFAGCTKLRFIDIASAESIGESAFEGDVSIDGNIILKKVSSLGAGAFKDCEKISMVTLGSQLEILEEEVFSGCVKLSSLIIPESITAIHTNALQGCVALYSINVPKTVQEIGTGAFANAMNLQKVYFYGEIPASWEKDSLDGCHSGLQIYYRSGKTSWEDLDGTWNSIPVNELNKFYTEGKDYYSFSNSGTSFGYETDYRIPRERYVDLMNVSLGSYYYAINKMWKGSCYGMAASTLEFYENAEFSVQDYDTEAECVFDLEAPKDKGAALTELIEQYQVSQFVPRVAGSNSIIAKNMSGYPAMIQKIEEFERSGGLSTDSVAEPIIMCVYSTYSGHALIPVSVEQTETGSYEIKVYDCNFPSALQTVTINEDMTELEYGKYKGGSYISYLAMVESLKLEETEDDSLYLSINKENGEVENSDGKRIGKIKGAYEQKPFRSDEEDSFSGIRSFVVPEGSYQIAAEATEEHTEDVEFYMASDDVFAQITSTDESTTLYVEEAANGTESLILESGSAAEAEDKITLSITNDADEVSNVEVEGNNIQITVSEDEQQSVSIQKTDGEELVATVNGEKVETDENGMISLDFVERGEEEPEATVAPEVSPTAEPSEEPEVRPSAEPSEQPVVTPTAEPSEEPEASPSAEPSEQPVVTPTAEPSEEPEASPSAEPSEQPVVTPTAEPSKEPEASPSAEPSELPEETPTAAPGPTQSTEPDPTAAPEPVETDAPTQTPEVSPTIEPSPSVMPSTSPSVMPEITPTLTPGSSPASTVSPGVSGTASQSALQAQDVLPEGFEEITGVKVDKKKLSMGVGEKYQIKAQVIPADAINQSLDYIVIYGDCIEVNKKGRIEALNAGKAKVLVEAFNGKLAVIEVTVKQPPKKISLNKKVKVLKKGKTFQIKVKFPKNTASANLTYKSSNKKVAKVNAKGKVKAVRKGRTVITVKTYNKKKAKMTIIVR